MDIKIIFSYSEKVNCKDGDLLLDYSKNLINEEVMKLLLELVSHV